MRALSVVFIFATVAIFGSYGSINVSMEDCYKTMKCSAYTDVTDKKLQEPICVTACVSASEPDSETFNIDTTVCGAEIIASCLKLVEHKQIKATTPGLCESRPACGMDCGLEGSSTPVCAVIDGKRQRFSSLCSFQSFVDCKEMDSSRYTIERYTSDTC